MLATVSMADPEIPAHQGLSRASDLVDCEDPGLPVQRAPCKHKFIKRMKCTVVCSLVIVLLGTIGLLVTNTGYEHNTANGVSNAMAKLVWAVPVRTFGWQRIVRRTSKPVNSLAQPNTAVDKIEAELGQMNNIVVDTEVEKVMKNIQRNADGSVVDKDLKKILVQLDATASVLNKRLAELARLQSRVEALELQQTELGNSTTEYREEIKLRKIFGYGIAIGIGITVGIVGLSFLTIGGINVSFALWRRLL